MSKTSREDADISSNVSFEPLIIHCKMEKNTCLTPSLVCNINNKINNKKIPLCLCTFTENVNCVAFTEFQILWALCIVVIQCHHLIENGPVGQRVLILGTRWKKQEVAKY